MTQVKRIITDFYTAFGRINEIIPHILDGYPNAAKQHKSVGIYSTRVIRVLRKTFKLRPAE